MVRGKKKKGLLPHTKPAPLFMAPKQAHGRGEQVEIDPLAGREFVLQLDGVSPGGEMSASLDGMHFFVDVGCPGQKVLAEVERSGGGAAHARRIRVLEESPFQTEAFCEYFSICGGCSWQEIPYGRQLEIKQENLAHVLAKTAGMMEPPLLPIVPSPEIRHFRSKMEFAFANLKVSSKEGEAAVLGLRKRGSHDVVAVERCPVASEALVPVLKIVRDWAAQSGLLAWEPGGENIGNRILRFLNTRTSFAGHGMAVELVTYPAPNAAKKIRHLGEILLDCAPVTSFAHMTREAGDNLAMGEKLVFSAGEKFLREKVGGYEFDLAPGAFFQTNIGVAGLLQDKVLELARGLDFAASEEKSEAWDLYSGVGALALLLAPFFSRVAGFEISSSAVLSARHNAGLNGFANCVFEAGDAQQLIRSFPGSPQLVVLDPPRAGLARELVKTLLIKNIHALIYVSCNPQTLARDLKSLGEKYDLVSVQGMDMFPHTPHVEAVALLKRRR